MTDDISGSNYASSSSAQAAAPTACVQGINRRLSFAEYYFSCIGASPHTLEERREIIFVLEGSGTLPVGVWQQALDAAARINPGARLRLVGARQRARWQSDGRPPRLRVVAGCGWDGQSKLGSEFITAEPLSLTDGPCCELIVTERDGNSRIIFRVLHAVMDGRGGLHFVHELFRALRQDLLLGTNSGSGNAELIRRLHVSYRPEADIETTAHFGGTASLTGEPQGDETGKTWRRLSVHGPQRDIMARVAAAMAAFAHSRSDLPMLFNIPVDLRRHLPTLRVTTNVTNNVALKLQPGEGPTDFKRRLQGTLAARRELKVNAAVAAVFHLLRFLPLAWLDRLLSRKPATYRKKRKYNTSVLSNLGRVSAESFRCGGFEPRAFYFYSESENAYCMMSSLDDRSELIVGMPCVYANEGRLEAFMHHLEQHLDERNSRDGRHQDPVPGQ